MKTFSLLHVVLLASGILVLGFFTIPAFAQETERMQELRQLIEVQQEQLQLQQQKLEEQQKKLELQDKQFDTQKQLLQELQLQLKSIVEEENTMVHEPADKAVTSDGGERVKLGISGHVNRMVSIIDDGADTDAYFLDNDNSESQVRFVATTEPTDDLTLGGIIEYSVAPNRSGNVDQLTQETGDIFDQRKVEVTFDSKRWGKLSLGMGNTASYGAGAVDLSETGVASYSTIVTIAGSMIFRESDTGDFSDVRIFEAFDSFDGQFYRNRLRYDSPRFRGFQISTSLISDDRSDATLWWGGQGYGFKAAGAVAIGNPNEEGSDLQYNGSFSLLHDDTGLNFTLSSGILDRDNQGNAQNYFAKVGWIKRFFSVGDTAFSVDYTRSLNLPTDKDDAYSVAAAAVQQFDDYGTEFYVLYRLHSLDRGIGPSVDDITVVSIGTRIKF